MPERYDVIIIGSGAGGGTLAHRLAPTGKRILILERGDWLPREADNWSVEAVFGVNRYVSPETWLTSDGKPFQPQVHYFVGGATKVFGAALYRLRKEDFGECATTTACRPPGRSATTNWSPITPRPSISTRCMGNTGSTRPIRRRAPLIRGRPSRTSRASPSSPRTSPRQAIIRFTPQPPC